MRDLTYRAATAAAKAAFRALDLRVRSEGVEHVPHGPVVLASTHSSFPDFLYVGATLLASGRRARFLCRADIWDSPVGRAMTAMRHVPVDRRAPAAAYLRSRTLLEHGEVVCVFPEAGISAAYVVRAMMPGAVALARETGAPLLPVTVWGGQRLWGQRRSVDAPFPRPSPRRGLTVDVRIGAPHHVAPGSSLTDAVRDLGTQLQTTLEGLQQLAEHRPRPGEWAPWYPAHLGGHALDRRASFDLDAMPRSAVTPTWGPLS